MVSGRPLSVEGPAGALQVVAEAPPGMPRGVAVVCHPHPLYEGSMHNKVVHTLARAFKSAGCVAVRFNFRGVELSEGAFADGLGELEDALAICRWTVKEWPDVPLALAGFSFGAAISLAAAAHERPFVLVTVAPPVAQLFDNAIEVPDCPWLIVQGDADELVDCDLVLEWVNDMQPGPQVSVLSGVDHFFHGRLVELRDIVTNFLVSQPSLSAAGH